MAQKYSKRVLDLVKTRNSHEKEFIQAVPPRLCQKSRAGKARGSFLSAPIHRESLIPRTQARISLIIMVPFIELKAKSL